MEYRTLGKTGWRVSVIGLGTWNNSGQWGEVDEQAAIDTVAAAVDAGVNFIDTADAYGDPQGLSEQRVGRALRSIDRDKVIVATKVGNWAARHGHRLPYTHPNHVVGCCHASLYRLGLDHIDLYQCHLGGGEHRDVFLEAFDRLLDEGLIRAFGVSTHDPKVVEAFNVDGKCAACQLDYSLINREPEKDLLPSCRQAEIGTIIRGPLAKGILSGKYSAESRFDDSVRAGWNEPGPKRDAFLAGLQTAEKLRPLAHEGRTMAQAALQFIAAHDAVSTIIPGAKSPEQARANAAAGEGKLTDAELESVAITP